MRAFLGVSHSLTAGPAWSTIELVSTVDVERVSGSKVRVSERLTSRYLELRDSFLRFLLVGAANTLVTGLLMIAIARWVDIEIAYTIVFILGLAFTTIAAGPFVFRSRLTSSAIRRFVSWYMCVYIVGVTIARVTGHQWHVSHALTTVAVLAITAPLNFLGGHRAFTARADLENARDPA